MDEIKIRKVLKDYFPKAFSEQSDYLATPSGKLTLNRVLSMSSEPINLTHFNQLLHLNLEGGVTKGFFEYYFLKCPEKHPYPLEKIVSQTPGLDEKGISTYDRFDFGLKRLYIDALLYWGDIRSAFEFLRKKTLEEIESFFQEKRFPSRELQKRPKVIPFSPIGIDDRYLISEIACKAYSDEEFDDGIPIENKLVEAYRAHGAGRIKIASLFEEGAELSKTDPQDQMILELGADEMMEETVENEEDIRVHVKKIAERFHKARTSAVANTDLYLSIVNELDVYVATSMRKREDFRSMARDCSEIFNDEGLRRFRLRYFDPTMSAAQKHEDKGLIECLMVKCAKAVLYFAGESDSFGKDAEIAMALSLGKPVIILCPETDKGAQRLRMFRDIHPLSRLIEFKTGVAHGAMVTQKKAIAAKLLERVFDNKMEYEVLHSGDGYFRLKEKLTDSVVRVQTNSRIIRETFWNYYHGLY